MPARSILTGVGTVRVTQPRVHDRRIVGENELGESINADGLSVERFRSKILPPYLRKTKSVEEFIPWLYLKGVSTGDFSEALGALIGPDATGLSASTVTRLVATWQNDYQAWNKRSLEGKQYVYRHELPAVQIGRERRFRAEDVLEFIARRPLTIRTQRQTRRSGFTGRR